MSAVWLRLLALLVASKLSVSLDACPSVDPCKSKAWQDRTDAYRDWNLIPPREESQRCDNDLTPGWYRFLNTGGDKLSIPVATTCPNQKDIEGRCSTTGPTIIIDRGGSGDNPRPADGMVLRDACLPLVSCCLLYEKICVRHCGDDGLVYYLEPLKGCPFSYCTGACVHVASWHLQLSNNSVR